MSLEVTKDFFRLLFNKVDADVGVEHIAHQNASRFCILGCLRSSIKSGLNLSRLSTKTSHEPLAGISTTTLPGFLMNTWSSLNLNSLGRRTAWLWPFRNNFAVFMCHLHIVYTLKYILSLCACARKIFIYAGQHLIHLKGQPHTFYPPYVEIFSRLLIRFLYLNCQD